MGAREAARWVALFVLITAGYFAYEYFVIEGERAFGITRSMRGEFVTVRATVVMMTGGKGHVFPILLDGRTQRTIKGVLFRDDNDPEGNRIQRELLELRLKDGGEVVVEGRVDVYDDELEIIIRAVH